MAEGVVLQTPQSEGIREGGKYFPDEGGAPPP